MGLYDQLNEMQLDAVKEIGNIGAGNACTALSVLLGTMVDMDVPNIHVLDFDSTSQYLGGDSNQILGIQVDVTDDLEGMMFHIVRKPFAERIINTFYEKHLEDFSNMDEMDTSVLSEMANITSGAYANSIATLTNLFVNIGAPVQTCATIGEVLKIPFNRMVKPGDKILVIDEEFEIDDKKVCSNMLLVLEHNSLMKLFDKLGVRTS
ncbi:MAG: chemotaxis protein CheC [Lachnospiraceae bacterium]|nr:chemotaxis protein CheC [Lachnospiraceae bacterium]